jgi:hypothetical protein
MSRNAQAIDDDAGTVPRPGWTRERLKAFVARRYNTRVHMSLILSSCGLTAMLASWFLLHHGVHSMLVRYPAAISLAYGTFLIGVWTWLRATGLAGGAATSDVPASARKAKSGKGDWLDLPSGGSSGGGGSGGGSSGGGGGIRGGGGTFDGGGASSSFAQTRAPMMAASMSQQDAADVAPHTSSGSSSSSSWGSRAGSSLFDGIDGDGIVLLILAVALVAVVFATSGYLVWCAPDVLTEAAFGAALTGTLSRPSATHAAGGWVAGVVRKTWWPFALVLVAAMAFAGWSTAHYPQASTFRQAIVMAIHSS